MTTTGYAGGCVFAPIVKKVEKDKNYLVENYQLCDRMGIGT